MPAFNLSPAQRADLRAQAHALKPVVIIGADGLTEPVVAEAERAIDSHQLIKIRVFGDDRDARVAMAEALSTRLNAALVQHIGKLLVFWRPSADADVKTAAIPAKKTSGRIGPSAGVAAARRAAQASPSGRRPALPVKAPARKTSIRKASDSVFATATNTTTASPRERAKARDALESAPRTGKGGAPRLVTVVKPTGNDRRRARPTQVLVRGNERVTAGGNVKKAKKRPTSIKRLRQAD